MSLTGIGVLLIGIAFIILSIYIAKVLNNTAGILKGVSKTIEKLPDQLDDVLLETGNLIKNSNETLSDVNEKISTLTPFFHIAGDVGESTRKIASSINDLSSTLKNKTVAVDPETKSKRLGGIYGTVALGYYAANKRKELKESGKIVRPAKLYATGKQRAFDIERMKAEAKQSAREGKYLIKDKE